MKRSRTLVDERRQRMLEALREDDGLNAEDLAARFHVSVITVRRDLQALEDMKKIERFYGGATVTDEPEGEDEINLYRRKIAQYAAGLVEDGDSIFINTSSTALQLIKYIRGKKVKVITNNGRAINIDHDSGVTVILTGGELSEFKGAMVGEFAITNISRVTAKKTFLGCSGLSPESGMTTEILNEVNINTLMATRVLGETFILCDHTKINRNSSFISCPIGSFGNIITDEQAPAETMDRFRELGVTVHTIEKEREYLRD